MNDQLDGVGGEVFFVPSGPLVGGVEMFEHFAGEVRGERFKKLGENDEVFVAGALFVELVDIFHKCGDGGVEVVFVDVFGDFLDGFMTDGSRVGS